MCFAKSALALARIAMNEAYTPELRGRMFAELAQYIYPKRKAFDASFVDTAGEDRELNDYDSHIDRHNGMKMDSDLVEKIRAARRKLATDGPARVRSTGDFERVSIGRSDSDVLRDLVLAERARPVIEVGLAYGASALAIAEALVANGSGQGCHLIIDAYQNRFYGSG